MSAQDAKAELRARFAAARRAMPDDHRARARRAVAGHVLARADGWPVVAAYEPLRTEPGSVALLAGLVAAGARVIVPVTLSDRDLDWAPWSAAGRGDALGREAVGDVSAVLVPASAVARDGTRLGRGGGSYDRALARVPATAPTVALVFDDELVADLPREPWDVAVTAAVRPAGWTDLGVAAGG
ncbi:5-formyltetrahydrofolate cyclo-ligase [Jatrophihabitans endophyticus]|uniref:5-formyltetrahydrofolate cyclo-ligase n=1 Tax=Jatrophihabitans endophyticus TaxID=1206085 RepID=A0A1M5U0M7_9ACTN|nr:5-formyltetrahydrofolate cyclo-ligase [Jatrophihabitans endophyticus]SHH56635.1 5-formyltetrahydrofolate cyclo-ligase [Jatrophihabitans endophyticus]